MMKKSIWIATFLFTVNEAIAQTDDTKTGNGFKVTTQYDFRPGANPGKSGSIQSLNDGYEQLIKNNTPVSPQAEAIEKYGTFAIDYSTGVPQISIPIFEIKIGDYALPITLAYHASGIILNCHG